MRSRAWLLSLYPAWWRDRYGDKFEVLLEETLHSPLDVLDVALGALDAHLDLAYGSNWRLMNMLNKLRTGILLVFAGYIGFIIGGFSLLGLVDDSPAVALMKISAPVSLSWRLIQVCSAIALLAVVIGGLPLAFTILRRAFTASRRDLRYLLVPLIAFLAIVLYLVVFAVIAPQLGPANEFTASKRLVLGGLMAVFVLGAIASTAAVWKLVSNTEAEADLQVLGRTPPIKVYEPAFTGAAITTLCLLLMLAGTLSFGWLAFNALPDWLAGDFGLLLTSTSVSYSATILVMALSTAVAIFGLARGWQARRLGAV